MIGRYARSRPSRPTGPLLRKLFCSQELRLVLSKIMQQKGLFYAPYGALFGAVGIAAVNTLMGGVVSYPAFRVSRVCLAAQVQRRREDNYDLASGKTTCKSVSSCRKVSHDGGTDYVNSRGWQ